MKWIRLYLLCWLNIFMWYIVQHVDSEFVDLLAVIIHTLSVLYFAYFLDKKKIKI
jgi:hypothetical protein